MKWISVKDRLPKKGEVVIVYRPNAEKHGDPIITEDKFTGVKSRDWDGIDHQFSRLNAPTHWMPLPEPPKR